MQAVKRLLAATTAAAVLAAAGAAGAAVFLNQSPTGPSGSISWSFGDDGDIAAGAFDETFNFAIPTAGVWSGTLSTSHTSAENDLQFAPAATINGLDFSTFTTHFQSFEMLPAAAGGATIVVHGVSPGPAGSYVGSLTFTPTLVPEPAAWALMILGFAGAGVALRQRRQVLALAV